MMNGLASPRKRIHWLGVTSALAAACVSSRPPVTEAFPRTQERLARGSYLAHHVADCFSCHSERLADRYGMPIKPGTVGAGGFRMDKSSGMPGVVLPPNITPDPETGIGAWTDGEIARAIREGVSRDGHALFPFMPYAYYQDMSDEDVQAVVAYLRTLPPVRHKTEPTSLDFPVSFFIRFSPKPVEKPVPTPNDAADPLAYGKYLTTVAGCKECHTAHDDRGSLIAGREYAGGFSIKAGGIANVSPNLTPQPGTYMGGVSREDFIGRFKSFEAAATPETAPPVDAANNTFMPWLPLSGMTEKDLGAIYDYLKTLAPRA